MGLSYYWRFALSSLLLVFSTRLALGLTLMATLILKFGFNVKELSMLEIGQIARPVDLIILVFGGIYFTNWAVKRTIEVYGYNYKQRVRISSGVVSMFFLIGVPVIWAGQPLRVYLTVRSWFPEMSY